MYIMRYKYSDVDYGDQPPVLLALPDETAAKRALARYSNERDYKDVELMEVRIEKRYELAPLQLVEV